MFKIMAVVAIVDDNMKIVMNIFFITFFILSLFLELVFFIRHVKFFSWFVQFAYDCDDQRVDYYSIITKAISIITAITMVVFSKLIS